MISRRTPRVAKSERATTTEPSVSTLRFAPPRADRGVEAACERARRREPARPAPTVAFDRPGPRPDPVLGGVLAPPLREKFIQNPDTRGPAAAGGPSAAGGLEPIMIELNLGFQPGVAEAVQRVLFLWRLVGGDGEPVQLGDEYLAGELSTCQLEGLVSADAAAGDSPKRAIYRIWPDFEMRPQIDASGATIKARAAQRTFESFGGWDRLGRSGFRRASRPPTLPGVRDADA